MFSYLYFSDWPTSPKLLSSWVGRRQRDWCRGVHRVRWQEQEQEQEKEQEQKQEKEQEQKEEKEQDQEQGDTI